MQGSDKHFLNSPSTLVVESLKGLCAQNPNVGLDVTHKVLYQENPDRSKVALVCGGGSGHEPAHAGYVGKGILNAAVCGNIFASPSANQVRRAIDLVDNEKGTVIIVKNYTGDVLNFGLAKERYLASHGQSGKDERVRFITVGDDVSVGRTQGSIVGRRGLSGTVLVYKIAGALADRGASLDEVYTVASWVAANVGTVGVGMEHCHVPGTGSSESHLSSSEVEIGMGIHNEPGHSRVSPIPSLRDLVSQLVDLIIRTDDIERSFLPFKHDGNDKVVLMVNNLGGVSELELGGIVGATVEVLEERKVKVIRVLAGTFMTSLNMPGFSLTILLLPRAAGSSGSEPIGDTPTETLVLSLLDEKPDVPGWKWSSAQPPPNSSSTGRDTHPTPPDHAGSDHATSHTKIAAADPNGFVQAIVRACKALKKAEPEITKMDQIAGDGDCGLTLKAGAEATLAQIDKGVINGNDIVGAALAIADVAEMHMGGTSGALYSIFFSAFAQGIVSSENQTSVASSSTLTSALSHALNRLYTYTRARPPSRTLIDPLAAFVEANSADASSQGIKIAVQKAGEAAERTRDLEAKAGRSAYVEGGLLKKERVTDPGAWGVKIVLESLFV